MGLPPNHPYITYMLMGFSLKKKHIHFVYLLHFQETSIFIWFHLAMDI